jgi:cell division septation protein DedD
MRWLQLVPPAGAIVLLALAALIDPTPALAVDNVVRVDPSGVEVAPGGSFHVKLIDDPTPASTAIWALDVVYDPAVVTTTNSDKDCDTIDTPGGAIGAFDCQVIDADKDGTPETVKILGVVLYTGTQTGLVDVSTLADITFHVVGEAGACTDLHLRVRSHADKDGNETGALVQDGRACVEAAAPPSGTASPVPVTPRTSEPTEPPTPTGDTGDATPSGVQQNGSPGQTAPTGGQGTSSGSTGPAGGSTTPSSDGSTGSASDDDGGAGPLVWVLVGGLVLVLAAGAAWSLVRLRGAKPPSDSPPS